MCKNESLFSDKLGIYKIYLFWLNFAEYALLTNQIFGDNVTNETIYWPEKCHF